MRALRSTGGWPQRGHNPRKPGRLSHHIIKAGLGSSYLLNVWNRRGETHSAHQVIAFSGQTHRGLPKNLRIRWTLADSGVSEEGFLEYLENWTEPYIVALRLAAQVLRAI